MNDTESHAAASPMPLRLDIGYVDAPHDACFAWLQRKYASIVPAAAEPPSSTTTKKQKPSVDAAVLQRLENDVTACDELRWRSFAFPSHPTKPLNTSYRHEPARRAGAPSTVIEVHHTPKQTSSTDATATADAPRHPYSLVITTRADSEAKRRAKKEEKRRARDGAPTTGTPTVEDMLGRIVREERQARLCRILGEEDVGHDTPDTSTWVSRWIPRSPRPLLGGYVSAPNRVDQARLLLFPQSGHRDVDTHAQDRPQRVPCYLRGSASVIAEESNPAAGGASPAAQVPVTVPTDGAAIYEGLSGEPSTYGGLHHSLTYACVRPAGVADDHRRRLGSWDTVEVSTAHKQPRTERQYAPERAKVQRVSLLEDSVAVKTSRGDPRHGTLVSATRATVLNTGGATRGEAGGGGAKKKKKRRSSSSSTAVTEDDSLLQLRVEDVYDSTVQHFALPKFWQRWVRSGGATPPTPAVDARTGTRGLEAAPRGLYRVRWSGGPGVELCRPGAGADSAMLPAWAAPVMPLVTVFGKLWSESWVQVPLSPSWTLTLRNQSAAVVPLDPNAVVVPPMVEETSAGCANGNGSAPSPATAATARGVSWLGQLGTHPYFWATQGPRWDAALVRGFKNDFNGLHHAQRWYSIISAELAYDGGKLKRSGARVEERSGTVAHASAEDGADVAEDVPVEHVPAAASTWRGTSLTAFANACMVDAVRDYPRASVGVSIVSQIPRLSITAFNEIVPRRFECSFSWFAAIKPRLGGAGGFGVELQSGLPAAGAPASAGAGTGADGMPSMRVSPVETFQHMKCGLTWRFDE
ncbi:hypothetical protein NESM_000436200 [Novymonas esmeraldas]|uniref:Uncharacterized protein n=1 Tax=Novymonas esmeraldas TaxID=1808958 RepID=A0AAW0EQ63_9TRYP